MDHKLARGHTRAFFTDVKKAQEQEGFGFAKIMELLYLSFSQSKKLTKTKSSQIYSKLYDQIAQSRGLVSIDSYTRKGDRHLSASFDGTIVATVMELFEAHGPDEKGLRRVLLRVDLSRSAAEMRLTDEATFVREHALRRFHERAGQVFSVSSLGRALSLIRFLELHLKPGIVSAFLLPTNEGAFLGLLFSSARSKQAVDIFSVGRAGPSQERIDGPRRSPSIINTFVSFDEMRGAQRSIHQQTSELLAKHDRWLSVFDYHPLFLDKYGKFDGASFPFIGEGLPVFETVQEDFTKLLKSSLWNEANPLPASGMFDDLVNLQRKLDRYGPNVMLTASGLDGDKLRAAMESGELNEDRLEGMTKADLLELLGPDSSS